MLKQLSGIEAWLSVSDKQQHVLHCGPNLTPIVILAIAWDGS